MAQGAVTSAVAPWLADLDDDWSLPNQNSAQAMHKIRPLNQENADPSSPKIKQDVARGSARHLERVALSNVNDKHCNSIFSRPTNSRPSQPASLASNKSVVQRHTLSRRAKSASPAKKDASLEWERRIIDGDVGYGDHTDLFGPSPLENIFSSPPKPSPTLPNAVDSSFARFRKPVVMPSSPPTRPPSTSKSAKAEALAIENTNVQRTVSGQTEIGNEEFSPVYISKHTTLRGDIEYAPLDSASAHMLHRSMAPLPVIQRAISDSAIDFGSDSSHTMAAEISLPDNLPTGTPPVARLGTFVNTKRGGLSDLGSFKARQLSPSSHPGFMSMTEYDRNEPSVVIDAADDDHSLPSTPLQASEYLSPRLSASPLKLFGMHDTFTNKRLLRRMSDLEIHVNDSAQAHTLRNGRVHSFGQGELDEHAFEAELSAHINDELSDDRDSQGSPPPDMVPPGALSPSGWQNNHAHSPDAHALGIKRKMSDRSTAKSRHDLGNANSQFSHNTSASIKRANGSPYKQPTPKRRRTVHQFELEEAALSTPSQDHYDEPDVQDVRHSQSSIDFANGPGTQDSMSKAYSVHEEIIDATEAFVSHPPRLQAIQEQLEASDGLGADLHAEARAIANRVAAYTLKSPRVDQRKRSITTQDFLDEAMQIMAVIRSRVGKQNGLTSVEESDEAEISTDSTQQHHNLQRASSLDRDATTGWRPRRALQQDPRVVSQLNRFAEKDGMDMVDTTLPALRRASSEQSYFEHSMTSQGHDSSIRITGPQRAISPTLSLSGALDAADYPTSKTNESTSTRRSDNVATFGPETVAHLIPAQVADMIFDARLNKWVRVKPSKAPRITRGSVSHSTSAAASDEDPFHQIPDLTVDEIREIQRMNTRQKAQEATDAHQAHPNVDSSAHGQVHFSSSTNPTKLSAFASSLPQPETRATSWGTMPNLKQSRGHLLSHHAATATLPYSAPQQSAQEPSLSCLQEESRISSQASSPKSVTIDQSEWEPVSARKQRLLSRSSTAKSVNGNVDDVGGSMRHNIRALPLAANAFRPLDRALAKVANTAEPVNRALSIVAELPDKRKFSVSLSVKKPTKGSANECTKRIASPTPSQALLSDLPEFTVHQIDEIRPSELALAKSVANHALEAAEDPFAMATESIVKSLTDAEPEELHWDQLRQLSLTDKQLTSLHGLDTFCDRLQALNISDNAISHVSGAPYTVRLLNAASNHITSLTAWQYLGNLQVLDLSRNSIDDLRGLDSLCHLRDLRLNHNRLTSLDGILELDGLARLEVTDNALVNVSFADAVMPSLEVLNLSCNAITHVSGLESLPSLHDMCLDENAIETIDKDLMTSTALTQLSVCGNRLEELDVSGLFNLQTLRLARNALQNLTGLSHLHRLETLDVRSQRNTQKNAYFATSIMQQSHHARCVMISGNKIADLQLPTACHSIHTLDMSDCGLSLLPSDFGLQLPNLRNVNLNHNALHDIRALANISGLEELHVNGNRIQQLRKTVATLAGLKSLRVLDLRDNPLTLGFYSTTASATTQPSALVSTHEEKSAPLTFGPMSMTTAQNNDWHTLLVPQLDSAIDVAHTDKLDKSTSMRRRVHEIVVTTSCKGLERLDGLRVSRKYLYKDDATWKRLVEIGVLKPSRGHPIAVES